MEAELKVKLNKHLKANIDVKFSILRDHSKFDNLDYENSGHTGFSSKEYVDKEFIKKVDGKGLTSNDYTTEDKEKLSTIERDAQKNNFIYNAQRGYEINDLIYHLVSGYSNFDDVVRVVVSERIFSGSSDGRKFQTYIFEKEYITDFIDESTTYYFRLYNLKKSYLVTITDLSHGQYTYVETDLLDGKVSKINGKGLSTNDFTNEYKSKIDSLQTQLALYQFTRQQIVAKYLEEFSLYVGTAVTIENYANAPRKTYEFLSNHSSWTWLKQWLISCRTNFEINQPRLSEFLSGVEVYWAYEMRAFLAESYQQAYPGSTDYTIETYANGWRPPSTIKEIQKKIPDAPKTTGTYKLRAVVDALGNPTYSWVIELI